MSLAATISDPAQAAAPPVYRSTRGGPERLDFADALLAGLAPDGGLYVPTAYPRFDEETIRNLRGKPYHEVAFDVIAPFVGDAIPPHALKTIITEAYGTFRHKAIAPLMSGTS